MRWAGIWGVLGLSGLVEQVGCLSDGQPVGDVVGGDGEVVSDPDRPPGFDPSCQGSVVTPTAADCGPSSIANIPSRGADHIAWPTPILYVDTPPSSGDHRPEWARWGEYDYLPPQRWLHNLEHGGIALLYDPCLDPIVVDALREFARAMPPDDSGEFRWVLTPYPGLPTLVTAATWEWTWQAGCFFEVQFGELSAFVTEHYRKSPEDFGSDGSFVQGWIGR